MVDGNGTETGHIIATTIGGRNGQPKQVSVSGTVSHFASLLLRFSEAGTSCLQ